ncbi:Ty3/gypsy retrotransposon protein, partial [Trifolium medium]|nr:Ty3/gypsy retrotransposon protein [Trifolium medium]
MVMELDEDESILESNEETAVNYSVGVDTQSEEMQLSLHALTGLPSYQTMKICGSHNQKTLQILLDSGSTHNFLDLEVAKKLGCKLEPVPPMIVTAGGGNKLHAPFVCRNFSCQIQQTTFVADVVVLPLGCYDLILGIPFLKSLGPILWDFNALQMEFKFNGKRFVLRGAKQNSIKVVSNKSFNQTLQQGAQLCYLSVDLIQQPNPLCLSLQSDVIIPAEIERLLHLYADLFENPQGLPPPRPGFDHKLPLKEGTTPFNIRPYRYSSIQKDIVDGLVEEIRLNQATIKDKFPIPLIEDLMDELGGSVIYSKLDLQSGYHQMRMAEGDEYKTAFKTHAGHFEYLVMPFGLTNAPASFQALMNRLFQSYLRKFVIIFFDDILVYSSSLTDHVTHLSKVFQVLRDNQLFLRREKCSFATPRVEYLGHFIDKEGISTDPNKVQAVSSWPLPSSIKQLRGFLGLAGYYRRFVKDFGKIAKPLTDMLKKDAFHWSTEATQAFTELKHALTSAPVLALPNFNQPFILETDASGK